MQRVWLVMIHGLFQFLRLGTNKMNIDSVNVTLLLGDEVVAASAQTNHIKRKRAEFACLKTKDQASVKGH